ncbi:VWA domain-containing protein [Stenotrophomonas sp. JC08]|uniref:VWA domain-containing protein n=1 Tax=Stenotrophomonas sp. JC08 TaxID=3445779 RepID=UPI003FA329C5
MKRTRTSSRHLPACSMAFALTVLAGWPALAGEPLWPEPASAVAGQVVPKQSRQRQTTPNFRAPTATVCSDVPRMHEVPDPQPQAQRRRGESTLTRKHVGARHEAVMPAPAAPAPPAPVASAALDAVAVTAEAKAKAKAKAGSMRVPPRRPLPPVPQQQGPVTAGVVDDNADFGGFRQFLQRHPQAQQLGRDTGVRQQLRVVDTQGRPVADAEVAVSAASGARMWARTDAGGKVWLHPNAFDDRDSDSYRIDVRHAGRTAQAQLRRGQKNTLDVVLAAAPVPARAKLDLVFMVDATGSMGDEIDKLRGSLQGIVREIGRLPSNPDICLGLVTYRDRGDEYFVRSWDLSGNVTAFQQVLDGVRANGGGDYPEAMNEAFDHAVQTLAWRGTGTTRLLLSLADALPHMDYPQPHYDSTMLAALGKGIKVLSVAASGQDTTGEIVQRQIAQYTGGRFIFLTYKDAENPRSGPGTETVHEVANYSVDTLDQLVVRLVREELAQLPAGG